MVYLTNNDNTNTADQLTGRGGYDYGNAAADLNPDDIESITALKGAAATALYGSRGSNSCNIDHNKKTFRGLGVTVNSGISVGLLTKKPSPNIRKNMVAVMDLIMKINRIFPVQGY